MRPWRTFRYDRVESGDQGRSKPRKSEGTEGAEFNGGFTLATKGELEAAKYRSGHQCSHFPGHGCQRISGFTVNDSFGESRNAIPGLLENSKFCIRVASPEFEERASPAACACKDVVVRTEKNE